MKSPIKTHAITLKSECNTIRLKSPIKDHPVTLVSEIIYEPIETPPPLGIGLMALEPNYEFNAILLNELFQLPAYDSLDILLPIQSVTGNPDGASGYALDADPTDIPLISVPVTPLLFLPTQEDIRYDFTDLTNPLKHATLFRPPVGGIRPALIVVGSGEDPYQDATTPEWLSEIAGLPYYFLFSVYNIIWLAYPYEEYPAPQNLIKRAVQYFRYHATEFFIDPDNILIYGYREGATIAFETSIGIDAAEIPGMETYPEELTSSLVHTAIYEEGVTHHKGLIQTGTGAHFGEATLNLVPDIEQNQASAINLPGEANLYLMARNQGQAVSLSFPYATNVITRLTDAWFMKILKQEHPDATLLTGSYNKKIVYPLVTAWANGHLI